MQLNVRKIIRLAILLVATGISLAGCQSAAKDPEETGAKKGGDHDDPAMHGMQSRPPQSNVAATDKSEIRIVIDNFTYSPSDVTIAPGTKVTWINKDEAPHTATSTDKKFNSGGLDTDDEFSFVFNDKGDYSYFCALHPQMKATIQVK
jgi:plastocyanin